MTAESDDPDAGTVVPGDKSAQDTTDGGTPVLDLDTLDDLTDDESADVGAAAARALAITEGSRERFGELVRQAVAPQIGETTRRISELVAGSAYKSILASGALAQTKTLSELVAESSASVLPN